MAKRDGVLEWDSFFMFSAALAAVRSKDPCTQVGAVIVNTDNRIVSSGYNGFCNGMSDDSGRWGKRDPEPMNNKHMYVCHAEMNAIVHSQVSCRGCTMYVTHHPCNECAKMIIQAGIKKVVFAKHWKKHHHTVIGAQTLFVETGVTLDQYQGPLSIVIELR